MDKYCVVLLDSDAPWRWSAVETVNRVRSGEVTAQEVTWSHLRRMDDVNPRLNAVTRRDDEAALAAARAVDARARDGLSLGPLAGVPVTIKDSVDVAGQSSPNGVHALDDRLATTDAPLVAHLRAAGAIVIGRTNAPEFSWRWHTDNPLFGPTRNPWDDARTPGGSSGGGAAAVAAGIGSIAQGSDAGGSLRWPAACCGVAAIRPTQHRVAMQNSTSEAERSPAIDMMAVAGPMARTVADLDVALRTMAQPTWRDPAHVLAPFSPVRATRRVGLVADEMGGDPAVATAQREAAARLADAGWHVREVAVPGLVEAAGLWAVLLNTDFHATTRARFIELGSDGLRLMLDVLDSIGPAVDLAGYIALLARRATLVRAWQRLLWEDVDVVLLPVCREQTWLAADDVSSRARLEELYRANEPLVAINFLGLPAVAVPVGSSRGMPMSVQIVAARFEEGTALAAAAAIESRQSTVLRPPSFW